MLSICTVDFVELCLNSHTPPTVMFRNIHTPSLFGPEPLDLSVYFRLNSVRSSFDHNLDQWTKFKI